MYLRIKQRGVDDRKTARPRATSHQHAKDLNRHHHLDTTKQKKSKPPRNRPDKPSRLRGNKQGCQRTEAGKSAPGICRDSSAANEKKTSCFLMPHRTSRHELQHRPRLWEILVCFHFPIQRQLKVLSGRRRRYIAAYAPPLKKDKTSKTHRVMSTIPNMWRSAPKTKRHQQWCYTSVHVSD
ncbi:unnamed protein product [Ectocarpus sp. 8 AP-2014]